MPPPESTADMTTRALLKWPDVPASYGWLGLDARGRWRIQGETISHPGIRDFLARQYTQDTRGQWYVQNGPQRGYVDLEIAPLVLVLDGRGQLLTHTGHTVRYVDTVVITDGAQLLLRTDLGLGVIHDRDLGGFLTGFNLDGRNLTDSEAGACLLDDPAHLPTSGLRWGAWSVAIMRVPAAMLEARFGFVRRPCDLTAGARASGPAT